jgi:hypothetical protein
MRPEQSAALIVSFRLHIVVFNFRNELDLRVKDFSVSLNALHFF